MTILFYPDPLNNICRLYPIVKNLNIDHHNDPNKPYDHFMFWSYNKTICPPDDILTKGKKIINIGCLDITKSRVEEIFQTGISVDPLTHNGCCVKKSEGQAFHDGEIIQCPSNRESGYVYQKAIDTKNDRGHFVDYRIFYSGQIDLVIKKEKSEMFKTKLISVEVIDPNIVLSNERQNEIAIKCKKFGLDFGELDMLFDKDGRPHVIDVNNIPGNGLLYNPLYKTIMDKYQETFKAFLRNWANENN